MSHYSTYLAELGITDIRDPIPVSARVTEITPIVGGARVRIVIAVYRDGVSGHRRTYRLPLWPFDEPELIRRILIHEFGFHPARVRLDKLPEDV